MGNSIAKREIEPPELSAKRTVEYVAPAKDAFIRLARAVSAEIAKRTHDSSILDPDVSAGLAAYLWLIAVLEARRANTESRI